MKCAAVALCAPSGTGKTTVVRELVKDSDELLFSVSATTRSIRPGEQDGVDYHFVNREAFESMIEAGAMLEWACVHGELYGTPRTNLEQAEQQGLALLLDIDVQGAQQLLQALPETVTIFLLPPSAEVLLQRLSGRGSEGDKELRTRLETAQAELEAVDAFRYVVINDRLEETVHAVRAIIEAESQRFSRRRSEVEALRERLRTDLGEAG